MMTPDELQASEQCTLVSAMGSKELGFEYWSVSKDGLEEARYVILWHNSDPYVRSCPRPPSGLPHQIKTASDHLILLNILGMIASNIQVSSGLQPCATLRDQR